MTLRTRIGELKRSLEVSRDKWPENKRVDAAIKQYKSVMGYSFDINNPELFTEKIVWYKLFYQNKDLKRIVDKYSFKEYIQEKIGDGYTIPLIGVWNSVDALRSDWDSLPNAFCLKSTLMSDGKGIKVIHNKSSVNFDALCKEVSHWLKPYNTLINSYCRAYYGTTPRILAENYEEQANGQLYDYKVFCFNGIPTFFYVATDHFPGQLSHISLYDLNWNKLDVRYGEHQNCDVQKPQHFNEMIELSRQLSGEFPFVRIDFFDLPDRVLLSELTFYPGGGLTPYHPESFNRELGDLFILPTRE